MVTKLNKDEGTVQVSSLIHAMGSQSENMYKSFTFGDGEGTNDFDVVLKKCDEYFVPRRNVIHEGHVSIRVYSDRDRKQRFL